MTASLQHAAREALAARFHTAGRGDGSEERGGGLRAKPAAPQRRRDEPSAKFEAACKMAGPSRSGGKGLRDVGTNLQRPPPLPRASKGHSADQLARATRLVESRAGRDYEFDDAADHSDEPRDAEPVLDMGSPLPAGYDATDDIQDIDRRLNALQQFLAVAKAPR